jgi:hypothetical protein
MICLILKDDFFLQKIILFSSLEGDVIYSLFGYDENSKGPPTLIGGQQFTYLWRFTMYVFRLVCSVCGEEMGFAMVDEPEPALAMETMSPALTVFCATCCVCKKLMEVEHLLALAGKRYLSSDRKE